MKRLHLDVGDDGHVSRVTVDMLEPQLSHPEQFVPVGVLPSGVFVSMGNPHYVVFTDDVDLVETDGAVLENHASFPQRCNIEFATLRPDGTIRCRVWERGSGITQACGTGACATAVAAILTRHTPRRLRIVMDGGVLEVEWREADNHVLLSGPAEFVYDGVIAPAAG